MPGRARHGVSLANVATRWVLEQAAVAAVIVGARLGEREHREDNCGPLLLEGWTRNTERIDANSCGEVAFPAIAAASIVALPF